MGPPCREIVALVTDYLEDALDPRVRRAFVSHVEGCEDCTAFLDQVRMTVALLGSLAPEPVEPATRERVLATLREWRATAQSAVTAPAAGAAPRTAKPPRPRS